MRLVYQKVVSQYFTAVQPMDKTPADDHILYYTRKNIKDGEDLESQLDDNLQRNEYSLDLALATDCLYET